MCFVMITPNGTLPWFSLVSYSFPRSIDLIHLLNFISLKIVWRLGHCFPSPSVLAFLGISIWTIFQIGALITEAGSLHHISCPSIIAGESHVIKFPPVEYEQKWYGHFFLTHQISHAFFPVLIGWHGEDQGCLENLSSKTTKPLLAWITEWLCVVELPSNMELVSGPLR